MNIISINNIIRKNEMLISYIKKFEGTLLYNILEKNESVPIEFIIESTPIEKKIKVHFIESPNYPILDAKRKIVEYIKNLDEEGKLI